MELLKKTNYYYDIEFLAAPEIGSGCQGCPSQFDCEECDSEDALDCCDYDIGYDYENLRVVARVTLSADIRNDTYIRMWAYESFEPFDAALAESGISDKLCRINTYVSEIDSYGIVLSKELIASESV